ncbi:MAG TPA: hemerythrin domain-containing protein [Bryobacterales bacterium]|nr:hemerythrin domain-containing protein [Bryobacterales bacterium]
MIRVEQLIAAKKGGPQEQATLDRPLDHLLACHRRIEERLEILERAAFHLESRRAEALEAMEGCLRFFDSNGVRHTADEEESLFPRLRQRLTAEQLAYLDQLERQHREADRLHAELRLVFAELSAEAAGAPLAARVQAVANDLGRLYRSHIASEDQTFLPLARQVLSWEQLRQLSNEMKSRRGIL